MSPKLIAVLKRFGAALVAGASIEYGILGHIPTSPKEWGAAILAAIGFAVEKYLSPPVEPHVHAVAQGLPEPPIPPPPTPPHG